MMTQKVTLDAYILNNQMPVKVDEGFTSSLTNQLLTRYSKSIWNNDCTSFLTFIFLSMFGLEL